MSAKKRTPKKSQAAADGVETQNDPAHDGKEPMKEPLALPLVPRSNANFTPLELAQLAALIDAAACKTDDPSAAVIKALELLEKCDIICTATMVEGSHEQLRVIDDNLPRGSEFAREMGRWLAVRALDALEKVPFLTLALTDKEPDTLRPYLDEHLKLEGKRKRKKGGYCGVKMVKNNLLKMFIDQANKHNLSNASKIQSREERIKNAAKAQGCPVEALGSSLTYDDEVWRDGMAEYEAFLRRCEVRYDGGIDYEQALKPPTERKQPKLVRYDIPLPDVNALIRWKHDIRLRGKGKSGLKNVRQLEREDVFSGQEKKFRKT